MSSGERFTIPHAEMLDVSKTTAKVHVSTTDEDRVRSTIRQISILLIESTEVEDAAAAESV